MYDYRDKIIFIAIISDELFIDYRDNILWFTTINRACDFTTIAQL